MRFGKYSQIDEMNVKRSQISLSIYIKLLKQIEKLSTNTPIYDNKQKPIYTR